MADEVLPEGVHAFAEGGVVGLAQVGVAVPELGGEGAREVDEGGVAEVGDAQFGYAALAHAEELAGAAQAQVLLGKSEAVVVGLEDFQPLLGGLAGIGAEHVAVGLVLAASDTAPELVELREAEAVGVLDYHDGGVGYVDADLDDGGGDQDVQFVVAEAAHGLILLCWLHCAVDEAQTLVGKDLAAQAFVLDGGGFGGQCFGLLDQGADDERLPTLRDLMGDERVRLVAPCAAAPARDDLLPTGRQLVDGGNIQIAVEREGQRARDGRRGHDQHVRVIAFLAQSVALLHAEAVLLIDDDEAEPLEVHIFLNQGVGANGNHRLPAFEGGASHAALLRLHTAGQQHGANAEGGQHLADAAGVLLGQDFGRGHDRALEAVERGQEKRGGRDRRFAGADIALQEAAHGAILRQIAANLHDDALLSLGEAEGQRGLERLIGGAHGSPERRAYGRRVRSPPQRLSPHQACCLLWLRRPRMAAR